MLSIFNGMFRTATKTDWDAPRHWRQDGPRKTARQLQREEILRQRRAMSLSGHLW